MDVFGAKMADEVWDCFTLPYTATHGSCHCLHHAEGHTRRASAAGRVTFGSRPLGVVLDRFIRTSPRVRSLNFRFADDPLGMQIRALPRVAAFSVKLARDRL